MNVPRDRHFIPAFYLKRWTTGGKLIEFSMLRGKVVSKSVGSRGTGYERDLYSFPDLPEATHQILESKFFNKTDDLAHRALCLLESGREVDAADLRSAWSRFILNLKPRHPDPFAEMRIHIRDGWMRSDAPIEEAYAAARPAGYPDTFELFVSLGSETLAKILLRLLQSVLDNARTNQRINHMCWNVLRLRRSKFELLTSDWPAEILLRDGVISLPIGPRLLFVAATTETLLRRIGSSDQTELVTKLNRFVVGRARRFVYSTNHQQQGLMKKIYVGGYR